MPIDIFCFAKSQNALEDWTLHEWSNQVRHDKTPLPALACYAKHRKAMRGYPILVNRSGRRKSIRASRHHRCRLFKFQSANYLLGYGSNLIEKTDTMLLGRLVDSDIEITRTDRGQSEFDSPSGRPP